MSLFVEITPSPFRRSLKKKNIFSPPGRWSQARGLSLQKRGFTLFLLLLFFSFSLSGQSVLEKKLFELPDVIFQEIATPNGYSSAYKIYVKQWLDHKNPEKGYFFQRAYLSHKSFDAPTVMVTEGYQQERNRISELGHLLDANQIIVEHRFFGESVPNKLDWEYLNLEQVTTDLHKINQLFRQIYSEKWVSTGISKSGQTSIFYRYFYPNDVDVSVPYVAPLNNSFEDQRIYTFLDNVGNKKCRKKIKAVQLRLLEDKDSFLPLLKWYVKGKGQTFTYMSLEEAFEYAVLEYPFSFWQMGHNCEGLPKSKASADEILQHFINVVGLDLYSDGDIKKYAPHYYQAATEMGYYGFETDEFEKHLDVLPEKPHAAFVPKGVSTTFDSRLLEKVTNWTKNEADQMLYIYGGTDTWSATAVEISDNVDALKFMMEGRHHGDARIRNMNKTQRSQFINSLERWLEMEIE